MKLVYNQQDNNNIIFERNTMWTFGSKDIQRIAILFLSKSARVTQFQKFKEFQKRWCHHPIFGSTTICT